MVLRSKKEIEGELQSLKQQVQEMSTINTNLKSMVDEKVKADATSSNLFALVKYMIDENKRTTMILGGIAGSLARLEGELAGEYAPQEEQQYSQQAAPQTRGTVPLSRLDTKILQQVQMMDMASAEDIQKRMNYKGRNAASSRLNRLYKQGLLERYQLGHKVYYKYDAGKATNPLIISPPQ
jgi:regulator of replication initiation timing